MEWQPSWGFPKEWWDRRYDHGRPSPGAVAAAVEIYHREMLKQLRREASIEPSPSETGSGVGETVVVGGGAAGGGGALDAADPGRLGRPQNGAVISQPGVG